LTAENNAGRLETGQYYIVVTNASSTSQCFIAYQKVMIYVEDENCLTGSLANDVIAFYPFSNGSIEDFSGNEYHLVAESQGQNVPIETTDRNGNSTCAYRFYRGIEPAYFRSIDTFDLYHKDFTISLWYQPLGNADSIFYDERLFSIGPPNGGLSLSLYECRNALFGWTNSCEDDQQYFGCDVAMTDHNWHHLVATYDYETNEMKLYRNNVLQDTKSEKVLNVIKRGVLVLGNGFNGKLDDVIMYSRVLDQNEVKKLYSIKPCCN